MSSPVAQVSAGRGVVDSVYMVNPVLDWQRKSKTLKTKTSFSDTDVEKQLKAELLTHKYKDENQRHLIVQRSSERLPNKFERRLFKYFRFSKPSVFAEFMLSKNMKQCFSCNSFYKQTFHQLNVKNKSIKPKSRKKVSHYRTPLSRIEICFGNK